MEGAPEQNKEEIKKQFEERINALSGKMGAFEYLGIVNAKVSQWREELGNDIRKYELYHVLIGSTPFPGQEFIAFDLPGKDNVANFVADLEKKYGRV